MENKKEESIRNIGIAFAIKRPSIYFTALLSGLFTFISIIIMMSVFEVKGGLDDYVFLFFTIFYLYIYSRLIDAYINIIEESKMYQSKPLLIIGYSNHLTFMQNEEIEMVYEADEIFINGLNSEQKSLFYDEDVSLLSCYKDSKKVIEYAVVGVSDFDGTILFRNRLRENEDIIKEIEEDSDELPDDKEIEK